MEDAVSDTPMTDAEEREFEWSSSYDKEQAGCKDYLIMAVPSDKVRALERATRLTKEQAQVLVEAFGLKSYTHFSYVGAADAVAALIAIAEQ